MNTNNALFVLLLCIGIATGLTYEPFFIGEREPGDRPIYINTLESIETEDYTTHDLYHEWIGDNEIFSLAYVELPFNYDWAQLSHYPFEKDSFKLEVHANTTQLFVNVIVFGFSNQTVSNSDANIKSGIEMVERKFNNL